MRIERLDETHQRSSFRCEVEVLDTWFHEHALTAQRQDTARTFVLVDDEGDVAGYYSLTMGSVDRTGAPSRFVRGLPRFPVPIVLLARLALDVRWHGRGLGASLLFEALHRATLAAEHAAARLIAVDPINDQVRSFYARWGFQPVGGDDRGRMFIRTGDALVSLPFDYG